MAQNSTQTTRVAAGLCRQCGKGPPTRGRCCGSCADECCRLASVRRAERRKSGLCVWCGGETAGHTKCKACLRRFAVYWADYQARLAHAKRKRRNR